MIAYADYPVSVVKSQCDVRIDEIIKTFQEISESMDQGGNKFSTLTQKADILTLKKELNATVFQLIGGGHGVSPVYSSSILAFCLANSSASSKSSSSRSSSSMAFDFTDWNSDSSESENLELFPPSLSAAVHDVATVSASTVSLSSSKYLNFLEKISLFNQFIIFARRSL